MKKKLLETYSDFNSWSKQTCSYKINPGLDRVRDLLNVIGNPQNKLKFIHVAGTNGKGSTCKILSSILKHSNFSVGLYSSPYVVEPYERIQLDDNFIDNTSFLRWVNYLKPFVENMLGEVTIFELWTVIALCYFGFEVKPDIIIWETGLGGKFDATNIVNPLGCIITNVSLDHQNFLGNTIEKIAIEKAGIIKKNKPIVCGCDDDASIDIVYKKALEMKSYSYFLNKEYGYVLNKDGTFDFFTYIESNVRYSNLKISLIGEHQIKNAAAAIMILEILNRLKLLHIKLTNDNISSALSNIRFLGRSDIEVYNNRRILLDGAHNIGSVIALKKSIENFSFESLILIVALMNDKGGARIFLPLLHLASKIFVTELDNERCLDSDLLKKELSEISPNNNISVNESVEETIKEALISSSEKDLILVTGSFYLVSEVYKVINTIRN